MSYESGGAGVRISSGAPLRSIDCAHGCPVPDESRHSHGLRFDLDRRLHRGRNPRVNVEFYVACLKRDH